MTKSPLNSGCPHTAIRIWSPGASVTTPASWMVVCARTLAGAPTRSAPRARQATVEITDDRIRIAPERAGLTGNGDGADTIRLLLSKGGTPNVPNGPNFASGTECSNSQTLVVLPLPCSLSVRFLSNGVKLLCPSG